MLAKSSVREKGRMGRVHVQNFRIYALGYDGIDREEGGDYLSGVEGGVAKW